VASRDNNTRIKDDEGSAEKADQGAKALMQTATVEERVEQIVTDYVQCSSIELTDTELAVITEKAKVWEIWDRLRRAYRGERRPPLYQMSQ